MIPASQTRGHIFQAVSHGQYIKNPYRGYTFLQQIIENPVISVNRTVDFDPGRPDTANLPIVVLILAMFAAEFPIGSAISNVIPALETPPS